MGGGEVNWGGQREGVHNGRWVGKLVAWGGQREGVHNGRRVFQFVFSSNYPSLP